MRLLPILAAGCFVSSMAMRVIDPLVPEVARDLAVDPAMVALLASAYSLPYALGQPVLGALGDVLGKALIIKIALAVLAACLVATALAPSLDWLFVVRIIGGAAGGGIIPLSFAMIGDRIPFAERQLALSRVLAAVIGGQVTGSLGSGLVGAYLGWRFSMAAGAALAVGALIVTLMQLNPRSSVERPTVNLAALTAGYGAVFRNPRSAVCFAAVFCEGIVIFGLFPYVALLLERRGAGGLSEAGLVLAGFAAGGFAYTALVGTMLPRLGLTRLIAGGGLVCGAGIAALALAVPWPVEMGVFGVIGIGFYMIHNSLQTQATELAPANRGSAVAAHAFFFFLGQALGPLIYRAALASIGPEATLIAMAALMIATGAFTAYGLARVP